MRHIHMDTRNQNSPPRSMLFTSCVSFNAVAVRYNMLNITTGFLTCIVLPLRKSHLWASLLGQRQILPAVFLQAFLTSQLYC